MMTRKKQTFSQKILNSSWFLKGYDKLIHPVFLTFFAKEKMNFQVIYQKLLTMDEEVKEGSTESSYSILDLACGTGWYGQKIALDQKRKNTQIYAVDIAQNALKVAQKNKEKKHLGNQVKIICCNAENLSIFKDHFFQEIWICGALHQMPNVDLVLDEIERVLASDGKLFCQTFIKDKEEQGLIIRVCEKLGHTCFEKQKLWEKLEARHLKIVEYSRHGLVAMFLAKYEM